MKFSYTCKNQDGQLQKGVIEAADQSQAGKMLQEQKLYVLDVKKEGEQKSKIAGKNIEIFGGRVSLKDKIIFTQQLAMMIQSGLPLMDAFKALEEQTENKYFSRVINEIATEVKGGKAFSEIIAKYPKIFPPIYVAIVKSGEKSGKLDEVLGRLAEQLQKDYELISKIKAAVTYPILIMCALVGIVFLMFIFVIPQLKTVFADMGAELPLVTRIILGISDAIIIYWYIWVVVIGGFVAGIYFGSKTPSGKMILDRIKIKIPLIGPLIKKIYMTRFCRTTGTLVASGLPILNIMETAQGIINNRIYQNAFKKISTDIENGVQLSQSLKQQHIFPAMIYHMVAVGEKSGKLDYVLLSMADFFDKEIEATTNSLATLIEPILIIFVGAGVGLVVASVIMPIYSLVDVI